MTEAIRKQPATSVNLDEAEKARWRALGVPLRTVFLVGLDELERQQREGDAGDSPVSSVPHRELTAMVRAAVSSEVARVLDERLGSRDAARAVPFRAAQR